MQCRPSTLSFTDMTQNLSRRVTLCWTGSAIKTKVYVDSVFISQKNKRKKKDVRAHQWCPFYTSPCTSDLQPLRGRNLRGRSCWAKWSRSRRNLGSSSCPPAPRRRQLGWGGRSRRPERWAPRRGRCPPPPWTDPTAGGCRRSASAC